MNKRSLTVLEYPAIIARLAALSSSAPGRALCEALLPSAQLDEAQTRQRESSDAMQLLLKAGTPPLHGIAEIRPSVGRAERGSQLTMGDLLEIARFLRAAERLRRLVPASDDEERSNVLYDMMARIVGDTALERRLSSAIVSEEEMADDASAQLADIRRRIRQTQASVREHLDRILRNQSRYLQEQLVTQRNGRYVVPVRAEARGHVEGIVHDSSNSGQTLFVEPLAVVAANNKLRELGAEERDEIDRILSAFSAEVGARAAALSADVALLAQIDFAIAKGRLGLAMEAHSPRLNAEGRIRLLRARHPLLPKETVVPIDLHIGEAFRCLVITGPNTGGKTVALKTCGLLTLMAMAGLAVPAGEQSELAVFDAVHADIGDEQSIEQNLSTFSAHMRHIVEIVEAADAGSLVLLDELGSGTDPSEGAALAMAILDDLLHSGATTLATTHYRELKGYALETPEVENACCEFDTETLRPTYKLLIGVPGVSNAFIISSKLGLPGRIIEHARERISGEGQRFEQLIRELDARSREQRDALEEAERLRQQLDEERRALRHERQDLAERRSQILQDSREAERRELSEQVALVEALVDDIRRSHLEGGGSAAALQDGEALRHELRRSLKRLENEIGRETLARRREVEGDEPVALEVGERYHAAGLGLTGRLLTLPDRRGEVQRRAGR